MKKNNKRNIIQAWLAYAEENYLFAKAGMKELFSPYHTICYLCQGSAEKYLKAYLIAQNWELKKTHDLSELLEYCVQREKSFDVLFPACEILNEYITAGRYPGDLPYESIIQKDALEALEAVENIRKHVLKIFGETL